MCTKYEHQTGLSYPKLKMNKTFYDLIRAHAAKVVTIQANV